MKAQGNYNYTLTHFTHSPGIHFERIGEVRTFTTFWKLITTIDFNLFETKLRSLSDEYTKTLGLCNDSLNRKILYYRSICDIFNKTGSLSLEKLNKELTQVKQLIGHRIRIKRGWFDIVGKGMKIVFGTLSQDDADFYSEKINKFDKNENTIEDLISSQSQIIRSTIINFNNTIGTLDYNEKILRENFNKIESHLNKSATEINYLELKYNFEEHSVLFSMILQQFQLEIITLTNSVLEAKKGYLHPAILTPETFVKELSLSSDRLPRGLNFPIPLDIEYIHKIYNILSLQVYFQDSKLTFIINIPLLQSYLFHVFRLNPFPTKTSEHNKYVLIKPSSKFLLIDENKQQYMQTNENDFDKCKKLDAAKYICEQKQPIWLSHVHPNCEVLLYQSANEIPDICDKRIVHLDQITFIQLNQKNSWLFVTPKNEILSLSCKNSNVPTDVILSNAGKITISGGCKGFSGSAMLSTEDNVASSVVNSDFIPAIDLKIGLCENNSVPLNLTYFTLNNKYQHLTAHIDDLNMASHKLKDIERLAAELQEEGRYEILSKSVPWVAYILAIIFMLYICYKIYRKCRNNANCPFSICVNVNQEVVTTPPQLEYRSETSSDQQEHIPLYNLNTKEMPKNDTSPQQADRDQPTRSHGYNLRNSVGKCGKRK